jgi:arginine exporter protein ArgO
MRHQDCGEATFYFEMLLLCAGIAAIGVIYLNIRYLDKTIPRFGRMHYLIFFRLGAGYGAKQEWAEPGPWRRMLVPWKTLGFSDLEAEKIARTELCAAIEAMLTCIVVTLLYKQMFPVVGRAIGLCS